MKVRVELEDHRERNKEGREKKKKSKTKQGEDVKRMAGGGSEIQVPLGLMNIFSIRTNHSH